MKINPVNALIAVLLSALLAYALWSLGGDLKSYVAVGAFVFFAGTLVPMIGGRYEYARNGFNLRVVSGVFFVLGLGVNVMFASLSLSATAYIVTNASLFLLYLLLGNSIHGARQ